MSEVAAIYGEARGVMKLLLPLSVVLPRKTKADKIFALNLNIYRNANFHILNQAKVKYRDMVHVLWHEKCNDITIAPPYRFVYTIYPGSGRKFDLGNVLSIVQKFTEDSLVSIGVIPDDNYKIIKAIDYRFGEINKEFPHVMLEIFHWDES